MKQWERPHSYTVHEKLWDSCHLNSATKAVGQLATSTARPKLWDSCHLNSLTKEIWRRQDSESTQYMKVSEKVSGPVTCVKVMSAPRVILSAYIQENMPQSDPFICCGISCRRTEKADPSWKWLELVFIQSWHRVVHMFSSVCPQSWPGVGYFYTQSNKFKK